METIPSLAEKTAYLENTIPKCRNYFEVLQTAEKVFENPMVMFDTAYKLLARTVGGPMDDPLWHEFATKGKFSVEIVRLVQAEKFTEMYAVSDTVTLMRSATLPYDRVNGNLFAKNGAQVANILIMECNHKFTDEDFALLRILCGLVSENLDYYGNHKMLPACANTIIDKLLDDAPLNTRHYKDELNELTDGLDKVLYVGVVDILKSDPTLVHIVYFCEHLKELRPDFKYYIHVNNIVIVMSFSKVVHNMPKELSAFADFLKSNNIYAGISGNFSDPLEIKKHYKQAVNALNYGTLLGGGNIFSYDIFRLELFVHYHLSYEDLTEMCNPVVLSIAAYDKANLTEYVRIIYANLQHSMNAKLAAESIGMSLELFNAAIAKITEIFEIDWLDGNMLFSVFRTIRLFKFFPEKFHNIPQF